MVQLEILSEMSFSFSTGKTVWTRRLSNRKRSTRCVYPTHSSRRSFSVDPDIPGWNDGWLSDEKAEAISRDQEKRQLLDLEWETLLADRDNLRYTLANGDPGVHLPVNLKRIIWSSKRIRQPEKVRHESVHGERIKSGIYHHVRSRFAI